MTVTLKIEKSVYGGKGLGRLGDGRVAFVAGAYPGETVKASITAEKKRFVECELAEVLERSPARLQAPDMALPGMVYAGVTPEAELEYKQDQLENFLWKLVRSVVPLTVHAPKKTLNYRNKVTYHLAKSKGEWCLGYRIEPSHEVIDITEDALAHEKINAELKNIREGVFGYIKRFATRSEIRELDDVTVRFTQIDGVKWWIGDAPKDLVLREKTDGRNFTVSAGGFYQINPEVGEDLVQTVKAAYLDGVENHPHILDLYCGVGVFGLTCQRAALQKGIEARLVGVESGRDAVHQAFENAKVFNQRASFFCETVGANVRKLRAGAETTVIVDPPRGGMEINAVQWLSRSKARRVFYVSCDPATLTRDLEILLRGGYSIRRVHLFNMFPRTARFETFVELERDVSED